jgi:hypothetical protein
MLPMDILTLETSRRIVYMLERLSADSHWAHRASGLRGSLLRALLEAESLSIDVPKQSRQEIEIRLEHLNQAGYDILNHAAQEIRTPELQEFFRNQPGIGK